MRIFLIPALDLLYRRLEKGFSRRQTILAALLGVAILVNFMFRAACPPERRFFRSQTSQTIALCASPDMVKNTVPLGAARSANSADPERRPSLL
jgi:hypothetical protein